MRKQLLYTLLAGIFALSLTSCGKSGDTLATIKVLDVNNQPVAGALVKVKGYDSNGVNPGNLDRETTSDGNGNAVFNFNDMYKRGSAGFAVLEIEASKAGMLGTGIIKVEDQVNNEATVSIQ